MCKIRMCYMMVLHVICILCEKKRFMVHIIASHKEKLKESPSQETPVVGMYTGGSLAHLHCESQSIN